MWLQTVPPVKNTHKTKEQEGKESGSYGKSIKRSGEGSVEMDQQVTGSSLTDFSTLKM
jgi:hypothetical protein